MEWDTKRLGASLVVAARDLRFSRSVADDAVRAAAASYRERISEYAEMKVLDTWYAQLSIDAIKQHFRKDRDAQARLLKAEEQARSQSSEAVFPKLTTAVGGHLRIKDNRRSSTTCRSARKRPRNTFESHRAIQKIAAP